MTDTLPEVAQQEIHNSIVRYLEYELELETMKAFKDKTPTQESIDNRRKKIKPNFEYHSWLQSLQASLDFMRNHDLSLATHTSKGVHSTVKSDNLLLDNSAINYSFYFVNSYCVPNPKLDANSNNTGGHAGHLKIIINFLNIKIFDSRLYLFIKDKNPDIQFFFEQQLTIDSFDYLINLLNYKVTQPITDGRNKQTLFPIENNLYHCIIPLFPSSLTHYVYQSINEIKYSNSSKEARKVRFNNDEKRNPIPYRDILNLAVVKLGGENAQNVSRLNNVQGGRNYLLPSLPPMLNIANSTFKPSKFASTIFAKSLANKVNPIIQDIFYVVKSAKNNVDTRDARKEAMDEILKRIFEFANYMRNDLPAGWTKDSELDECEQFWLDPKRAELPDEEEWSTRREQTEWHKEIIHRFARWMNTLLQEKFKDIRTEIADPEHTQWERDIQAMKSLYERAGKGVFL